jgi:hypothetical protein
MYMLFSKALEKACLLIKEKPVDQKLSPSEGQNVQCVMPNNIFTAF